MATLSAAQLADIRLVTGADDSTIISDALLQGYYDSASTDAPDSTFILPYTYVYTLRRLWGYQRTKVSRTTDWGDNEQRQTIIDNTKTLLDYWEGKAGLEGGGILSAGALSFGLDYTETDLSNEYDPS